MSLTYDCHPTEDADRAWVWETFQQTLAAEHVMTVRKDGEITAVWGIAKPNKEGFVEHVYWSKNSREWMKAEYSEVYDYTFKDQNVKGTFGVISRQHKYADIAFNRLRNKVVPERYLISKEMSRDYCTEDYYWVGWTREQYAQWVKDGKPSAQDD